MSTKPPEYSKERGSEIPDCLFLGIPPKPLNDKEIRMSAYEIFQNLSQCEWWSEQSPKMRWIAARYYANVISINQLRDMNLPRMCKEYWNGKCFMLPPLLTEKQIEEIIHLR